MNKNVLSVFILISMGIGSSIIITVISSLLKNFSQVVLFSIGYGFFVGPIIGIILVVIKKFAKSS